MYPSENLQAYRNDYFRLQIIATVLLILYVAMAPCICFCVVTCVKKVTQCQCEKPPSANLVCEGL